MNGWKTESTDITFRYCEINSSYNKEINLLGESLNTKASFNNCKFNISRYLLTLNYGSLSFEGCDFKFNDFNTDKDVVDLNSSGYGLEECPWYFDKCTFESKLAMNIYGDISDCEAYGDINLKNKSK